MSIITETVRRTVFVMVSMEMFQKPGEQKKSWVSFVSFFMAAYAIRMGFDKSTLNYAAVKGREHKVTIISGPLLGKVGPLLGKVGHATSVQNR